MNNRSRRLACNAAALGVWWMLALIGCGSEDETETSSTPLTIHQACEQGDLDALRVLVEDGVDVDEGDARGLTPLHHGVMHQRAAIVTYLLEHNANIDAQIPSTRLTPLHLASSIGDTAIADQLLKHGADVHATAGDGSTPLHLVHGVKMATLLVDAGADVNLSNGIGLTPLLWAERTYQDDVAKFLHSRGAVQLETPAIIAAVADRANTAQIQQLIDGGADVNAIDIRGYTALHEAVDVNAADVVALLIDHGADPNVEAKGGFLPLHSAIASGNASVVQTLLGGGADPDLKTAFAETPRAFLQRLIRTNPSDGRLRDTGRVMSAKPTR